MTYLLAIVSAIVIGLSQAAQAQQPCCAGSGCCGLGGGPGPAVDCLLDFGSFGRVTDFETGEPIAGASIEVSAEGEGTVVGETAADGTYDLIGSVQTHCNVDYGIGVSVQANGYYEVFDRFYSSSTFRHVDFELDRLMVGDCRQMRRVTILDLVAAVSVLLGRLPVSACPALDSDLDGEVTIDEVVEAMANALGTREQPY